MTHLTLTQLRELMKLAEKATQDGWREQFWRGALEGPDGLKLRIMAHGPIHTVTGDNSLNAVLADMEYLAALNPTVAKDLITRLIGLSEAVKQYADASEDSPHKPQVARTALEKYGVRDE